MRVCPERGAGSTVPVFLTGFQTKGCGQFNFQNRALENVGTVEKDTISVSYDAVVEIFLFVLPAFFKENKFEKIT